MILCKNGIQTLLCLCLCVFAATLHAQELPQPSTLSSVTAVVGLTEIKMSYSAPAVKGRKIWDGLVPYGKLWRSGANAATTLTFADPVTIADKSVPAGIYSFFTIPSPKAWTLVLNKNHALNGTTGYDSTLDVIRWQAKPFAYCEFRERLNYSIVALNDEEGEVSLLWENIKVSFIIKTDPEAKALANIKSKMDELSGAWYSLARSAEYFYDNNLDLAEANKWVDMSIQMQEHFYNRWVKARILARQNLLQDALVLAQEAKVLGEKGKTAFYVARKEELQNFISTLQEKIKTGSKQK